MFASSLMLNVFWDMIRHDRDRTLGLWACGSALWSLNDPREGFGSLGETSAWETEKDSHLYQGPEIRLKYVFDILLLTLLIEVNLKIDADLFQPLLKQHKTELNHFVNTRSTGQSSMLISDQHIIFHIFFSTCTYRPPGSLKLLPEAVEENWALGGDLGECA